MDPTALVTGLLTLAGTLAGVRLTQNHAERLAHQDRINADRERVRALLARLIHSSFEWVSIMEIAVPAQSKFESRDLYEWVNTDSARRQAEVNRELQSAFGEALLYIGDAEILEPLGRAYTLFTQAPEKAMGPVVPSDSRPTGDALFDNVLEGLKHVWKFKRAVQELQLAAAPLVRTTILQPRPERRVVRTPRLVGWARSVPSRISKRLGR